MLFGQQVNLLRQYREWPLGKIGGKAEQLQRFLVWTVNSRCVFKFFTLLAATVKEAEARAIQVFTLDL